MHDTSDAAVPADPALRSPHIEEAAARVGAAHGTEPSQGSPERMELYQRVFDYTPDGLLVVDAAGCIVRANTQAERLFGYGAEELAGVTVETLIPQRYRAGHVAHRRDYLAEPRMRPMGKDLELFGLRRDGSEFPVDIMLGPVEGGEHPKILCVVRDITERKQTERELTTLREKEVLLKEIHHRVKNNLAVISSLFYLQSTYTEDENTIRILRECRDRVRSMALVHERLYRSENFAAVDFGEYARDLSEQLVRNLGDPARPVALRTRLASVPMSIGLAVPCGLILNELITNALKHAFPSGAGDGTIEVSIQRESDGVCHLTVADTGVGVPENVGGEDAHSLGLRLIRTLTRQIDGEFELAPAHPGTAARLKVKVDA
ncbi:MAG TPA: histidine kinase dimerization/phosphoacceptor domain -containing protein [Phycisphaerae bacterium]|nr:PAS domain S-box protein [Phycisphaerales bacterium]HRX84869.1 histidine kinase dimerization/phosphoacceptor domain -containing protein [Phycisphaerae bacterium]